MSTVVYRTFLQPLALLTGGITSQYMTIDPYGLLTFGLEWQRSNIWERIDANVTTIWTNIDF